MKSLIFDIQRFCTHDGPGIRTVVFLKGCPLDCFWCHNPESRSNRKQLFYTPNLCISCEGCVSTCIKGAHSIDQGSHRFDRNLCDTCLKCADTCVTGALETAGREMTVDEVLVEVEKDRVFYEESGGGLTISGGEPMAHFEFTKKLLMKAKSSGISTCIETSGFGPKEHFIELVPLVDLFLWDIKDTNGDRHIANTGVPLEPILGNLRAVDQVGGKTLLRCLLLSGVNLNQDHLENIHRIHAGLTNCQGVELLAYHPYGSSKYERLGMHNGDVSGLVPSDEEMALARAMLQSHPKDS